MRKTLLFAIIILLASANLPAQSFSINTDGSIADTSAILDVKSTSKGILVPRMSKTQRNTVFQPAAGLLVYQDAPDSVGFYFYDGSKWLALVSSATLLGVDTVAWKRTGNAGTNPAVNFIGTTDNRALNFRVNNLKAGSIDHILRNTSFGMSALSVATGIQNVAIGDSALKNSTTATAQTAIGFSAMKKNTTGLYNSALGSFSLHENLIGTHNTALGYLSMLNNTGSFNTAVGAFSLVSGTTGIRNTGVGGAALYWNNGNDNVAMGYECLNQNFSGSWNVAIGSNALRNSFMGSKNTVIGDSAMLNNFSGSSNVAIGKNALHRGDKSYIVAIGDSALYNNGVGAVGLQGLQNTAIGSKAMAGNTTGFRNSVVGYNALRSNVSGYDNVAIGSFALDSNIAGGGSVAVGSGALKSLSDNWFANIAIGLDAMRNVKYGNWGVAIGHNALGNAYSANDNIMIGGYAGYNIVNSGGNVGIGYATLREQKNGGGNIAIGNGGVLSEDTSSLWNTAVGAFAMQNHKRGDQNVAIGNSSLLWDSIGFYNTAVGSNALNQNREGGYNVSLGYYSMYSHRKNHFNTAVGSQALSFDTSGTANTAIGYGSLLQSRNGNYNTAVGLNSGSSSQFGDSLTMIGYGSNVLNNNLSNAGAIGAGAYIGTNNAISIGDTIKGTTVGIGTAYPTKAGLVVNTTVGGNLHAMFGSRTTGVSIESAWPGVGFNTHYNAGRKYIGNGFGGIINVDPAVGHMYLLVNGTGIADNNVTTNKGVVIREGGGVTAGSFTPYADLTFTLGAPTFRWIAVYAQNTAIQTSDAREKKNIASIQYGLNEIMQLRPVRYQWKNKNAGEQVMLGLLAQEVKKVLPEIIVETNDSYGMRTTEIIPVLIKAVQEQQQIIDKQQKLLEEMMKRLEAVEKK